MRMFLILLALVMSSAAHAQTSQCSGGVLADTRLFAETEANGGGSAAEDKEQEEEPEDEEDEEPDCE